MATSADVAQARAALTALSRHAQAALASLLTDVPDTARIARMSADEVTALYLTIRDRWWLIAERYGSMATALGQAQGVVMLNDLGRAAPPLRAVQGVRDGNAAAAAVTFALGQDDWRAGLLSALDGHLMDANSDAILTVAEDAQGDVLWVPSGAQTCSYCLKRASYGAYSDFRSEAQKQGFQSKPHDHCDCRVVIVLEDSDWPDSYHPTEYAQVVAERERAKRVNAFDRQAEGHGTPGPKTRQSVRRDRSAQAWADRQRIERERDAAKKRLQRAQESGDTGAADSAREVLARTKAERDRLNGH